MDTDSGHDHIGGQNTSGVNTFSGNFTLGANPNAGKSVTLIGGTGGEVDSPALSSPMAAIPRRASRWATAL